MGKKTITLAITFSILLLLVWLVSHHYFSPVLQEEKTSPEPIKVVSPPVNETVNHVQEIKPATLDSGTLASPKGTVESQTMSLDKVEIGDDKAVNLSDYNESMKKEEKKGFKILPGVTVKSGVAHVQLDQENNRYIEIERNPANSNSQYQMMLRKKF